MEPHPYVPYVYKRHMLSQKGGEANYPLHHGKYQFGQYTTNNFRFNNGPNGNRDIVVPKPDGLLRIACVGASITGNYIVHEGKSYSYPMQLEKILKEKLRSPLEVNNCGQGGYNSADVLVRFSLSILDTDPDIVILYISYSDIKCYFTEDFDSDYSHCRRNLGDTYWQYKLSGSIPKTRLHFFEFLVNVWLPANIRYSLLDAISKGRVDMSLDPSKGLATYERNIQSIIALCRDRGIKVILNTSCHYLYDAIKDDESKRSIDRIIRQENQIIRKLAERYSIPLIDNERDFPLDESLFVDSLHFTPEGMLTLAEAIAPEVERLIQTTHRPVSSA